MTASSATRSSFAGRAEPVEGPLCKFLRALPGQPAPDGLHVHFLHKKERRSKGGVSSRDPPKRAANARTPVVAVGERGSTYD